MYVNQERAVLCTALFFMGCCLLGSCQSSPRASLETLAKNSSVNQPIEIQTDSFKIVGWTNNKNTRHVNVYIEGDGQAWEDPWTVSVDPSPYDPMGFKLAAVDNRPDSVLYLARPCQFVSDNKCTPLDWTNNRFSNKIIQAYLQALTKLKQKWKTNTFMLHGYSGGATIALLIASNRTDIKGVVTFAPLLDPVKWTSYHQYSPLSGSLSPLHYVDRLKHIPQYHFIGEVDEDIPYALSERYLSAIQPSPYIRVQKILNFNHHSDWPELWKSYIIKQNEM